MPGAPSAPRRRALRSAAMPARLTGCAPPQSRPTWRLSAPRAACAHPEVAVRRGGRRATASRHLRHAHCDCLPHARANAPRVKSGKGARPRRAISRSSVASALTRPRTTRHAHLARSRRALMGGKTTAGHVTSMATARVIGASTTAEERTRPMEPPAAIAPRRRTTETRGVRIIPPLQNNAFRRLVTVGLSGVGRMIGELGWVVTLIVMRAISTMEMRIGRPRAGPIPPAVPGTVGRRQCAAKPPPAHHGDDTAAQGRNCMQSHSAANLDGLRK